MRIEQAFYGEHRGGHSLLEWSGDDEVAAGIVDRLDLPDAEPPGVQWSPFLGGFPYQGCYVLSRTFRDTTASRSGMVFSHALLARLDEISDLSDLRPLLKLFATSDRERPPVTTVQLDPAEESLPESDALVGAAEALVMNAGLPVVRLGRLGFDELVVALWARLWPEIRSGFAFRLSFSPRDLVETPAPALVCSPRSMAARWSDYPLIQTAACGEPASLAAAILSGHEKAGPLLEFIERIGSKPKTFVDLHWAEQAHVLSSGEPAVERRIGALRLVEKLSSDPVAGQDGKGAFVRELSERLPTAGAEDVLLLRNLQLSGSPSLTSVWKAVELWMAQNAFSRQEDGEMLSVLEDATSSAAAVREWRSAVLSGFATAAESHRSRFCAAFWRWVEMRPEIVATLFQYMPEAAAIEGHLAEGMPPNPGEEGVLALLLPASSRGWFRLHGALLSAACSPLDAARQQASVDTDPSALAGLRSALRNAHGAEVVECGLEIDDARLARLAGEVVASKPALLASVSMSRQKAQTIWREALAIDLESWRGPADPAAAFHSILSRMLDGGEVDTSLIALLSDSPLADLGSYARRSEIWSRLSGVALNNLLAATASGWIREASEAGRPPFVPEDTLQSAILGSDSELDHALSGLVPDRTGTVVRTVATLRGYDEGRFLRWINNMLMRTDLLPGSDSEAVGRLILDREWRRLASDMAERYRSGRQDLRPLLRTCHAILRFWDRWGLAPVSESEKWKALESLAVELYPSGPDDQSLWERAGGKDADLPSKGTGRMRWRQGLRDMRNGKRHAPSALLAEMMKDFPSNQRLLHLARDSVFSKKTRKRYAKHKRRKARGEESE